MLRVKVRIRTLMSFVVFVAVVAGLRRRSEQFARQANAHHRAWFTATTEAQRAYHQQMGSKYDEAVIRPWTVVPADPPEPE